MPKKPWLWQRYQHFRNVEGPHAFDSAHSSSYMLVYRCLHNIRGANTNTKATLNSDFAPLYAAHTTLISEAEAWGASDLMHFHVFFMLILGMLIGLYRVSEWYWSFYRGPEIMNVVWWTSQSVACILNLSDTWWPCWSSINLSDSGRFPQWNRG